MATCAHNGQAVAMAAALCVEQNLLPADLMEKHRMNELQKRLIRSGQYIPHVRLEDSEDLVQSANVTSSSELELKGLS